MCSTSLSGDAVCLPGKKEGSEGSGSDSAGGGNYRRDGRKFGDMEQNASVHPSGSVQSEGDGRSVVHPACRAHPFCVSGGDAVDAGGE